MEKTASFEKEIALPNVSEDEVLNLIDYPTLLTMLKYKVPTDKKEIFRILESEKIVVSRNLNYDITNLGAILFANERQ